LRAPVCGSVIISAFVALTLRQPWRPPPQALEGVNTAALFNFFERGFHWITDHYMRGLRWSLANRWVIVLITTRRAGRMIRVVSRIGTGTPAQGDKGWNVALVISRNGSTVRIQPTGKLRKAERLIAEIPN